MATSCRSRRARAVTVGGAIASDIHGKNHHLDGSFGNHVKRPLAAAGRRLRGRHRARSPARPVLGDRRRHGPHGVILDATVRLLRVETSRSPSTPPARPTSTRSSRSWTRRPLPPLLGGLDRSDGQRRPTGPERAHEGRPRASTSCCPAMPSTRSRYGPHQVIAVPPLVPPPSVLNHLSVAVLNEFWFRKAPRRRGADHVDPGLLPPARRGGVVEPAVRPAGVPAVPVRGAFGEEATLRTVLERLAASGTTSFLAVLKRSAPPTRTAQFRSPAGPWPSTSRWRSGLAGCCTASTTWCWGRRAPLPGQGRAHDTDACGRGYPRLDEWRAIRAAVDPTGVWASDQSRRLRLLED